MNAITASPRLRRLATGLAGLEDRRAPAFAAETLQQWWCRTGGARATGPSDRRTFDDPRRWVVLWPDTFTNHFEPHIGQAAVEVLRAAGWHVEIPTEPLCCGLTWISTGQLDVARRVLRRTVRHLARRVRAGVPVVGLEPSCTAVFRSDLVDLLPDDRDARRLHDHTLTFAELLMDHGDWTPPASGEPVSAIAQVHCHQHAVLSWEADRRLLASAGVEVERLDSGCCGLAGNFGMTAGHGEISRALGERALLPRVREADPGTVVLADGFSCRTQIRDLDHGGHEGHHLAELIAGLLHARDRETTIDAKSTIKEEHDDHDRGR